MASEAINWEQLAIAQKTDPDFVSYQKAPVSLVLKPIHLALDGPAVFCDVSANLIRPFIPIGFRRQAFLTVHSQSHPGIRATVKSALQRFVWPSIKADVTKWTRNCIDCQKSKVTRHVNTSPGIFALPEQRFTHVHLDIIILPVSEGNRYCLTCVDRFTRWPEAFPMENQEAETVARTFYAGWIARFGTPLRITTDQGRQFESHLFRQLSALTGASHLHTTAYHPAANGMVERLHRQLKAALMCHSNDRWTQVLPTVLMGIRASHKEDLQATPAEMVYGDTIRLPGEFLHAGTESLTARTPSDFVEELREHFRALRPTPGSRHGERKTFVFKELDTASHVFIRHDATRRPLQQPYDGPYKVVHRSDKTFVVNVRGRDTTVSIERLKPAFLSQECDVQAGPQDEDEHAPIGQPSAHISPPTPDLSASPPTQGGSAGGNSEYVTRAGRRVHFPDRLQVGLY